METKVVIVGAGPSGLATSACLSRSSIPYVMLEREDCYASLWKKRTYNRVSLHLAKEFCALPFMPHPSTSPTFLPKDAFLCYIDDYVSHFNIKPRYFRTVISASYDKTQKIWRIEAKNSAEGKVEVYFAEFLVVASGENSEGHIPALPGLDGFGGEVVHSNHYRSGLQYENKDVFVVGCGNSGMEIAHDLSVFSANPCIVVRSAFHVLSKESVHRGMSLLKYLPIRLVDALTIMHAKLKYGNLSKYGIHRPKTGPFSLKVKTGRSPVIDVGTVQKIQKGEIKIVPEILKIQKDIVVFKDDTERKFDAIVFATGYRSTANHWLKDYEYALNDQGMPKNCFPSHWKGENGLYCVGLSRRGLHGITMDAEAVANDIIKVISSGTRSS